MRWSFFTGITPGMIDGFKSSLIVSESDCGLDGFVRMMEDCEYSSRSRALSLYAERHREEYESYWRGMLGENAVIPSGYNAIETYLIDTGRKDEFERFAVDHAAALSGHLDKGEIQERLVEEHLVPLLERSRRGRIYVYRDRDHKGVCIEK